MAPRSVEELMDLLYACRGADAPDHPGSDGRRADLLDHALHTAALLRRRRPADKELQVAGLVHGIGRLLGPVVPEAGPEDGAAVAARSADAVRGLLGERVARLVRRQAVPGEARRAQPADEDALSLRQAREEALSDGSDAGVLEDWRTLLELVAARNSRLGALD
jgi:predicted HD phosphohydrolase